MKNGKSKDEKSALGKNFLSVDGAVPGSIQKSRTGNLMCFYMFMLQVLKSIQDNYKLVGFCLGS